MNHRVNAVVHKLPECPECDAAALEPCHERGLQREPHRVRQRVASGELFVIRRSTAKAKGRVRLLTELVAAMAVRR